MSTGPYHLVTRPYPYKRQPFQLATGEDVTYEGIYFSIPASGLLLEKRLFTAEAGHPVASPIKLYINRDAGLAPTIEPDDDGKVYTSGTPHYADYIIDLRTLIDEVSALHAADSDHTAGDFLDAHLCRAREDYNVSGIGVSNRQYVHPEPANTVPSGEFPPGASGALPPPGDGHELGAQQIMDIDMDEIQWQPIARPKKLGTDAPSSLPIEPIWPPVLNGGLPTFSSRDTSQMDLLAIGAETSGGMIVTGDGLFTGTSIKLVDASGAVALAEGTFKQSVDSKQFPCKNELCNYYSGPQGSGVINARGRQAVYNAPGYSSRGVYALVVSDAGEASGKLVQYWPGNYYSTSGIDPNGHAHPGVHVTDKLIYNIYSLEGGVVPGFSPINGKKIFGHWAGLETGSKGEGWSTSGPKYANGEMIYMAGAITAPAINNFTASRQNWGSTNNRFSPLSWSSLTTTALVPTRGIFGAPNGVTYAVGDINASEDDGVVTRKVYAGWGYIDQIVCPDQDQAQGGQRTTGTINYRTETYREGTGPNGQFMWILEGVTTSSQEVVYFRDTYGCNNIFSFFFFRQFRRGHGLVNVNGRIYYQWSQQNEPIHRFAVVGNAARESRQFPTRSRSQTISSIGFFPSWKLVLTVTTNNQVTIPTEIRITPAGPSISFHPDLNFSLSNVDTFGPPAWDEANGVNYIFFTAKISGQTKTFFALMDTSFEIYQINQTNGDGIFGGRAALLNI